MTPDGATFAWLSLPHHQKILTLLAQRGGEGRFVGSAVRNSLLGLPIHDYDIATSHRPQVVEELAAAWGVKVIPTGRAYGTLTCVLPDCTYEVTSLRRDLSTDGRHAQVAYTTDWAQDAGRRDFTINALYLDHNARVYDFHHGLDDLRAQHVRFIGDPAQRIEEDFLRILRFFRFTAWYGRGPLDTDGLEACIAHKAGIGRLARERITHETLALLNAAYPWYVLEALVDHNFLPLMIGMKDLDSPLLGHRLDALRRFEAACGGQDTWGEDFLPLLRLKALLPETNLSLDGLRLTRIQKKAWLTPGEKARKFLDMVEDVAVSNAAPLLLADYWHTWNAQRAHHTLTPFPLTGHDLTALGVTPGTGMGQLLRDLRMWWEGQVDTHARPPGRSECVDKARALIQSGGLASSQREEGT